MTHNARYFFASALIVLGAAFVILLYARTIPCAWCHESWAIHERAIGDLCRSCARVFDRRRAKVGHKRSILRRIWRTAA